MRMALDGTGGFLVPRRLACKLGRDRREASLYGLRKSWPAYPAPTVGFYIRGIIFSMKTFTLFVLIALLVLVGCEDPSTIQGANLPEAGPSRVQGVMRQTIDEAATDQATGSGNAEEENDPSFGSGGAFSGAAQGVVISEVLVGVPGDNNREFIELYNASDAAVDLDGLFSVVSGGCRAG